MPTNSIFKNVYIEDDRSAKAFIDVLETISNQQGKDTQPDIQFLELTKTDVEKIFSKNREALI